MNHDPVPSVTLAAAYEVFPPASNPSLSGVIVAVVNAIVMTNSTEPNASTILVTLANFGFFMRFNLSGEVVRHCGRILANNDFGSGHAES
jgi:hypothetical protein